MERSQGNIRGFVFPFTDYERNDSVVYVIILELLDKYRCQWYNVDT